jgi:predicted butyrate kinase (DUF1464 family)
MVLPSIPWRTARLKAIYLLQIAAEVEHALMAQCLYLHMVTFRALGHMERYQYNLPEVSHLYSLPGWRNRQTQRT